MPGRSVTASSLKDDLKEMVRDAVRCHFADDEVPGVIRLHFVRDEAIAV